MVSEIDEDLLHVGDRMQWLYVRAEHIDLAIERFKLSFKNLATKFAVSYYKEGNFHFPKIKPRNWLLEQTHCWFLGRYQRCIGRRLYNKIIHLSTAKESISCLLFQGNVLECFVNLTPIEVENGMNLYPLLPLPVLVNKLDDDELILYLIDPKNPLRKGYGQAVYFDTQNRVNDNHLSSVLICNV